MILEDFSAVYWIRNAIVYLQNSLNGPHSEPRDSSLHTIIVVFEVII
jgi:hypothetical protein